MFEFDEHGELVERHRDLMVEGAGQVVVAKVLPYGDPDRDPRNR